MNTVILNALRAMMPLLRLAAAQSKTTVDDSLVSFLEAVLGNPAQAPHMLAMANAAHAQMQAAATQATAQPEGSEPEKGKGKGK